MSHASQKLWSFGVFSHHFSPFFSEFFSDSRYQKLSQKPFQSACHKVTYRLLILTCRTLPSSQETDEAIHTVEQTDHQMQFGKYTEIYAHFHVSTVLGIIFHFCKYVLF